MSVTRAAKPFGSLVAASSATLGPILGNLEAYEMTAGDEELPPRR
jgi:hypothetical protein